MSAKICGQAAVAIVVLSIVPGLSPVGRGQESFMVEAESDQVANSESLRRSMIELLKDSFVREKEFVQIHAAEALVEADEVDDVAAALNAEVETAPPIRRVGVWRTMARCAKSPAERAAYVARLREVMLTPGEADRIHAAESLAKLGEKLVADRTAVEQLAKISKPAHACHCLWVLALAGENSAESRLVALLKADDPIARLASGYVLARLPSLSAESRAALIAAADAEPSDSPACGYLLAAALLTCDDAGRDDRKAKLLAQMARGTVGEQYEGALVLGLRGDADDLRHLAVDKNLSGDARIGRAQGTLRLLSRLKSN